MRSGKTPSSARQRTRSSRACGAPSATGRSGCCSLSLWSTQSHRFQSHRCCPFSCSMCSRRATQRSGSPSSSSSTPHRISSRCPSGSGSLASHAGASAAHGSQDGRSACPHGHSACSLARAMSIRTFSCSSGADFPAAADSSTGQSRPTSSTTMSSSPESAARAHILHSGSSCPSSLQSRAQACPSSSWAGPDTPLMRRSKDPPSSLRSGCSSCCSRWCAAQSHSPWRLSSQSPRRSTAKFLRESRPTSAARPCLTACPTSLSSPRRCSPRSRKTTTGCSTTFLCQICALWSTASRPCWSSRTACCFGPFCVSRDASHQSFSSSASQSKICNRSSSCLWSWSHPCLAPQPCSMPCDTLRPDSSKRARCPTRRSASTSTPSTHRHHELTSDRRKQHNPG
eukprot:comp14197_c0_seq1/m.20284 comp14197_c0_seq1/g.20284  ORF comp14197_c0_seq1/g.20284 comp14197_c0_seq1/m.20284 type:complete len:398 (-) comp14197_c0_seq1:38-1231(-)